MPSLSRSQASLLLTRSLSMLPEPPTPLPLPLARAPTRHGRQSPPHAASSARSAPGRAFTRVGTARPRWCSPRATPPPLDPTATGTATPPRPPWPWPPLHAEPPLEPAPTPINPQIRLLSSQRSSRARPSPPHLAGAPPPRLSSPPARRSPWRHHYRPPRAPKPPPTGAHKPPHTFPQLPPRRRGRTSPETAPSGPPLLSVRLGASS